MLKKTLYVCFFLICTLSTKVFAVLIGYYPGLQALIDKADAIVVLRIDSHIDTRSTPNLSTTHSCFVYQTLKGEIKSGETLPLRLRNTSLLRNFETPFALGSTHLMFLAKAGPGDPAIEYQTMHYQGANIPLSPLGHEQLPKGKSLKDKIETLIKQSIEYQKKAAEQEVEFLNSLLKK